MRRGSSCCLFLFLMLGIPVIHTFAGDRTAEVLVRHDAPQHSPQAANAKPRLSAEQKQLFKEYTQRHKACVEGSLPCQYVLVTTSTHRGGLGNRLPSIATGLLLAMLTNRTLMVNYDSWTTGVSQETLFMHHLDFSWPRQLERLRKRGQNVTAVTFEEQPADQNIYATANFQVKYSNTTLLHIYMDRDYQGAVLQSNLHYTSFFRSHFPSGSIFYPVSLYLFRLAPDLHHQVDSIVRQYYGTYTVGVQLRLLKSDFPMFHSWRPPPTVEAYCSAAKALRAGYGPAERVKFFVTADSTSAYAEVERILGADNVILGTNARDSDGVTVAGNPGTEASAVMDLKLLSLCSDMVISSGSSFGGVAAAWGGVTPVYMVFGHHADLKNPYFWRALSPEPCFWGARAFLAQAAGDVVAAFKRNGLWMQYTQCH